MPLFSSARWTWVAVLSFALLLTGCGSADTPGDAPIPSHPAGIALDGDFSDWPSVPVLVQDPTGDGGAIDISSLSLAHDRTHLFVSFELEEALTLQQRNDLTLQLDLDADASTGDAEGVDLSWTFGDRSGTLHAAGSRSIRHDDIGLQSLPTVSARRYEVSLKRTATPGGSPWLADGDTVCVVLDSRMDRAPDAGQACYALIGAPDAPRTGPADLGRPENAQVRLMSHNVLQDTIFTEPVRGAYERIYRTVAPDAFALQEVYDHDAEETRRRIAQLTGTTPGDWHAAKLGLDLVTVSRFPILNTYTIPGFEDYESGAALLDTRDRIGRPLLLINMHPPCCTGGNPSSDTKRQRVVDAVTAFVRDLRGDDPPMSVPARSPIVVAGDMNFVGDAQQPNSLASGAILNTALFGESAAPDWDDSPLLDVNPGQTGAPQHTTWENPDSQYPPGRLDFVYLTDSVADAAHAYVLATQTLPDSVRAATGLQPGDAMQASDHRPLVVDVAVRE